MRNLIYDSGNSRIATNILYKMLSGQYPDTQGFHFDSLIANKVIENAIEKYWSKFLSWSNWLGNVTSTIIGIYMVGRLIKFVIDTIMHGRILYDIYGIGWQLLASFWDSLTNFLSHRNAMKRTSTLHKEIPVEEPNEGICEEGSALSPTFPIYPRLPNLDSQ